MAPPVGEMSMDVEFVPGETRVRATERNRRDAWVAA
jgi:hypothetical protein